MAAAPDLPKRFRRSQHIRHGWEFRRAKEKGRRVICGCLIMNWIEPPQGSEPRLGLITTRKLGNAVVRNRARRLLRESFRLLQHTLQQPVDIVLVARKSIIGMKQQEVQADFQRALKRARLTA